MEGIINVEKDGNYYLKLMRTEIDKINSMACLAEHELENGENLPEEITGKIRAAAGKARLLVRQKFKQFEGLCNQNLSDQTNEAFPVKNEDLAGFWDMVLIQVSQVYDAFDELNKLKNNNYVIALEVKSKSIVAKSITPKNNRLKKTNQSSEAPTSLHHSNGKS